MKFTIHVSDDHGAQTHPVRSAREAIDKLADLLNADFRLDRLADRDGGTIDYDAIVHAANARALLN